MGHNKARETANLEQGICNKSDTHIFGNSIFQTVRIRRFLEPTGINEKLNCRIIDKGPTNILYFTYYREWELSPTPLFCAK
jgi:hypothetical protein